MKLLSVEKFQIVHDCVLFLHDIIHNKYMYMYMYIHVKQVCMLPWQRARLC